MVVVSTAVNDDLINRSMVMLCYVLFYLYHILHFMFLQTWKLSIGAVHGRNLVQIKLHRCVLKYLIFVLLV